MSQTSDTFDERAQVPRIVYSPPKAMAHGHATRHRNPRRAWEAIQGFLARHTINSELSDCVSLEVTWYDQWNDREVTTATQAEAAAQFGPPRVSGGCHKWALPVDHLNEALEFAFADDRRPKQSLGPVSLYFTYIFAWRDLPNPLP